MIFMIPLYSDQPSWLFVTVSVDHSPFPGNAGNGGLIVSLACALQLSYQRIRNGVIMIIPAARFR